jgi:hypothetical protein
MVGSLLLWNTQGNKQSLEILLEEAKYDILAIQEPWINPFTKSTYCPRSSKYYLIHQPEGRAAIYVSKQYRVEAWDFEVARDYCKVWFSPANNQGRGLEIWSIYNPPDTKAVPSALLTGPRPGQPTILAGDFNLHHPLWDYYGRTDSKADDLLQLALLWELDLRTPFGTITREPQGSQRGRPSTIDHFWASVGLETTYQGLAERGKSDHYPQVLEINQGPRQAPLAREGWNWKMRDGGSVKAEAAHLPRSSGLLDPGPTGLRARITTVEGLSRAFDWLVEELTRIATITTPRRKPYSGHQAHWWGPAVKEASQEARRAERQYKEAPNEHTKTALNRSLKALSKAITQARTKTWRTTLQEAGDDSKLLWALEQWARCKSFLPPDPPKLPAFTGLLSPTGQPTSLTTFEQKAEALAKKFFPSPPADLADIHETTFSIQYDQQPGLEVNRIVLPTDIAVVLKGMGPWKAPGEDLLPVGLLKACGKPLRKVLAPLITACFRLEWFPERFKRAKTIVLAKPGKKPSDYKTPAGYRPIALLPAIGKVIEAIVARRVTYWAENKGLLPEEQMGNRQYRSTELAIRLVVAQVQEAWR